MMKNKRKITDNCASEDPDYKNKFWYNNKLCEIIKTNRNADARASAPIHALWVVLVSILMIDVCIQHNISFFWPFAWLVTSFMLIFSCIFMSGIWVKRVLLMDFFLAASILSFILLGTHQQEIIVCYIADFGHMDNVQTGAISNFSAHIQYLIHNTNSVIGYIGLEIPVDTRCFMAAKTDNGADESYMVEIGILTGQAIYALYLAELANRQLLEKERLRILK
jgi:hypothetical protein